MNKISNTGENLVIIINCEYLPHHSWMTFASWYSISKNLPDAKCIILCKRGFYKINLFTWANVCKVPVYQIKDENIDYNKIGIKDNINKISINCNCMAINTWNEDLLGPLTVKSDNFCTFVDYFDQCGKFNGNEWVGRIEHPFNNVESFYDDDLFLNEYKVFKMWNKCKNIYNLIK